MPKENKDKVEFKNLLNTYSVKEISDLFAKVDEKIMRLHQCSSDDFLMLNKDFKTIFKYRNQIDSNISDIFNFMAQINSDLLIKELESVNEYIKNTNSIRLKNKEKKSELLNELSNKIRLVFIPLRNFGQNLMYLRLLFSNLNLIITSEEKQNIETESFIEISERMAFKCKILSEKNYKELNNLRKNIKNSSQNISQKLKKEYEIEKTISESVNQLQQLINEIINIEKLADSVKKRNLEIKDSADNIITNIQYHDIIRQKMEHIQQTHKDFMSELSEFDKSNEEKKFLIEKAIQFLKIRDISGLHATKLLHTNKEYQNAIEIIIKNFLNIGDNINLNVNSFNKLISSEKEIIDLKLNKLSFINDQLNSFDNKSKSTLEEQEHLIILFNHIALNFNLLKELSGEIELYIQESNEKVIINHEENQTFSNQFNQIIQILGEMKKSFERIEINFVPLLKIIEEYKVIHNKQDNKIYNTEGKNDLLKKINSIAEKLTNTILEINKKINENDKSSNLVLEKIKQSISNIKYYDYFDQLAGEITTELNVINYHLKNSYSNNTVSNKINLEQLKDYYTMDTEYKIHDDVINKKSKGKNKSTNKNEKEDVEYF
ncbi:MAG: hypothetical protein A2041_15020 [Bacteroidetes bacterium GWA2_31_9b]|nr:MAG: hypothetical protein A2041_15020 [Bacteroidetes bacterium GWA2_31_9b]